MFSVRAGRATMRKDCITHAYACQVVLLRFAHPTFERIISPIISSKDALMVTRRTLAPIMDREAL